MAKSIWLYALCAATILLINVTPTVFYVWSSIGNPQLSERLGISMAEIYIPFLAWALAFEVVRKWMPWAFLWKSMIYWALSFPFVAVVRDFIRMGETFWVYWQAQPHLGVALFYLLSQIAWGLGYGFLFYMAYGVLQLIIARLMKARGVRPPPGGQAPSPST